MMGLNVPNPPPELQDDWVGGIVKCSYCHTWGNIPSCKFCGAPLSPPPARFVPDMPKPYRDPPVPSKTQNIYADGRPAPPPRPEPKEQGLPPADNTSERK